MLPTSGSRQSLQTSLRVRLLGQTYIQTVVLSTCRCGPSYKSQAQSINQCNLQSAWLGTCVELTCIRDHILDVYSLHLSCGLHNMCDNLGYLMGCCLLNSTVPGILLKPAWHSSIGPNSHPHTCVSISGTGRYKSKLRTPICQTDSMQALSICYQY